MKYAKFIVAALLAALAAAYAALTDSQITPQEWVTIALAAASAVGVYLVPNRTTPAPEPPRETS